MSADHVAALGFDFDHTLGLDGGLEKRAFAMYARELGVAVDGTDGAWEGRVDRALEWMRSGEVSIDDMVRQFFADHGVAADGSRWRAICFELVPELVRPVDGALDLLAHLRARHVPFAILTNGWTPLQQQKIAAALGALAEAPILVSDTLGALKPAREAFDALVDALRVPRAQLWYVGDNPVGDVGGALAAGLRAVWFDWEGLRYPQKLPPPTLRVERLRELETLVENGPAP